MPFKKRAKKKKRRERARRKERRKARQGSKEQISFCGNGKIKLLARMPVPKFVCEASKASELAWFMGGDGDTSLDKRHDVAIRPYCTLEKEFRNTHARYS